MIRSISMKGVTSFSPEEAVNIETGEKKVLLFYGLNGTGKSTIADFLQDPSDSYFNNCTVDCSAGYEPEFIVYNQSFIEKNFLQSGTQPGVFTLSEENKEAELTIEKARQEIQKLKQESIKIATESEKLVQSKSNKTEMIKNKVWKTKAEFEKTPLESCMSGCMGSRDRFLLEVRNTPFESSTEGFGSLTKQAIELQDQESKEKLLITELESALTTIENNPVFQETIIGSSESYLSELINRLSNSDWVRQGTDYLDIENEKCPFCQQNLPDGFENSIQKLFDQSYQAKLDELAKLHSQYKAVMEQIETVLNGDAFQDAYVTEDVSFNNAKDKYLVLIRKNLGKINEKIKFPGEKVHLTDSTALLAPLNESIKGIRAKIEIFNEKITNRKVHQEALRVEFWKRVRAKYQDALLDYQQESEKLDSDIKQKDKELSQINSSTKSHTATISKNQENITNIDLSIERINRQMALLGLEGFAIEKLADNTNYYRLRRNNNDSYIYKTLSEGEKTLITFLYFLELCQGSPQSTGAVDSANRIIVVDDPISSLSHNYIYDVASMIHHQVIEAGYRQIIIFTHSLFFFHELLKLKKPGSDCPKEYKLFRITKHGFSKVNSMGRCDIQNDYESYWQIIRDAQTGMAKNVVLPNIMRNILEYYFSFVHGQSNLKKALEQLESTDAEFRPFYRYISRQSHSDAINIADFGELDPERYIEKFKRIFEITKFEAHYEKMMEVKDDE